MEQIQRIKQMELCLDNVSSAVMQLSKALRQYELVQGEMKALSYYYGSDDWKCDVASDEAHCLPQHLKRGVLSEDAVWNLLEDNQSLKKRMRQLIDDIDK